MTTACILTIRCIIVIIGLVGLMIFVIIAGNEHGTRAIASRIAILQSLGIDSLAIHSECDATRKPADGICACLTEIPGGYCYHSACDVVGLPPVLDDDRYQLAIIAHTGAGHGH